MSLASWLDGVNKKHASTVYASQEIDKEYARIRRRRSKSLGSVEDSKNSLPIKNTPNTPQSAHKPTRIHIPFSNFNSTTNTHRKWNDGANALSPATPRKSNSQTTPSTPTSSWANNRVVGATIRSSRAIPSPKERGIPVSPSTRSRSDYLASSLADTSASAKKLDFSGSRKGGKSEAVKQARSPRSPLVSHYESRNGSDVFGAVLHDSANSNRDARRGAIKEAEKYGRKDAGNKENVPPERDAEDHSNADQGSLGTSLGISLQDRSAQTASRSSGTERERERGPVMRPRQPNVLKRWQPESLASLNTQRERKISPSLRQLKARSMPTFPPLSIADAAPPAPTRSARTSLTSSYSASSGKADSAEMAAARANSAKDKDTDRRDRSPNTFTPFNTLHEFDYAHDKETDTDTLTTKTQTKTNNKTIDTTNTANDTRGTIDYTHNHINHTHTNFSDADSEPGDISQSSLIEVDVTDDALPQFDLASTPRSDIFHAQMLFPPVVAPKPIPVHVGNPLGRIEEEAREEVRMEQHRPLPSQPQGSARVGSRPPTPSSPNRGRPLPSPFHSPSMQRNALSPQHTPMLTPRHALPTPPETLAFADAVNANHINTAPLALKPKRTYKPALNKTRNAPSTQLNPPSLAVSGTPPPNTAAPTY